MESSNSSMKLEHKKLFEEFCNQKYVGTKCTTSKTVAKARKGRIEEVLRGENLDQHSPSFRFWVKKTKDFKLLNCPELELLDVLCLPVKVKNESDPTFFSNHRIVAVVEDFYSILERIHSVENCHVGYKKTLAEVQRTYECMPRQAVQYFCSTCPVCQQKESQISTAPLKPILASGFLSRCQIDLIDMRHMPDNSYNYIAHYMDHWSKFHILWPLMKKAAIEVSMGLMTRVFPYIGLPKILQSDNGREFVNDIVKETLSLWPGEVVIINGRPRHSQSQGLVEKGNHLVEMQLQAMKYEWKGSGSPPWVDWLPRIQYNLNTQICRTLKTSPYEVVFGQPPRATPFPQLPSNRCTIMEEDISDLLNECGGDSPQSPDNNVLVSPIHILSPSSSHLSLSPSNRFHSQHLSPSPESPSPESPSPGVTIKEDCNVSPIQNSQLTSKVIALQQMSSDELVQKIATVISAFPQDSEKEIQSELFMTSCKQRNQRRTSSNTIACMTNVQYEAVADFLVSKFCINNMQLFSYALDFVLPKALCQLIMNMFDLDKEEAKRILFTSNRKRDAENRDGPIRLHSNHVSPSPSQYSSPPPSYCSLPSPSNYSLQSPSQCSSPSHYSSPSPEHSCHSSPTSSCHFSPKRRCYSSSPVASSHALSDQKFSFASLTTSERHQSIRLKADQNYRRSAERMKLQYSKKKRQHVRAYVTGDFVTLRIPRNERSSLDMPRVLCRVLEVKRNDNYKLQCEHGVLSICYRSSELMPYRGILKFSSECDDREVTLREAAKKMQMKKGEIRCNCNRSCNSGRCSCKAAGLNCSTHCHPKNSSCTNRYEAEKSDNRVEQEGKVVQPIPVNDSRLKSEKSVPIDEDIEQDGTSRRRRRCGNCEGCTAKDCGQCRFCLDKPKFGGKGVLKQCCIYKKCKNLAGGTKGTSQTSQTVLKCSQSDLKMEDNGHLVSTINDCQIFVSNLRTLHGHSWLDDKIIDGYVYLVMDKVNYITARSIMSVSCFIYKKLMNEGCTTAIKWIKEDALLYRRIMIPIHSGNHWSLVVVDTVEKEFRYYDSKLKDGSTCLEKIRILLSKKYEGQNFSDWKMLCPKDVPVQTNSYDCGVFTCMFARFQALDLPFSFHQNNIQALRKKMIFELSNIELLD